MPLRTFGLDAAFAAIAPIFTTDAIPAGFLLVANRTARHLTPALTERLATAAALAAPLLSCPGETHEPGRPSLTRAPLQAAIRPRATAQRLVESAMRGRRAVGPAGLMMLDLDRFRAVNEALGIAAGDALLAVTGTRLQQALGPPTVCSASKATASSSSPPASRLTSARSRGICSQAVSQPLVLDGRTVVMQASIGIVTATPGQTTQAMLQQADTALRRAKVEGRARFVLHEAAEDGMATEPVASSSTFPMPWPTARCTLPTSPTSTSATAG